MNLIKFINDENNIYEVSFNIINNNPRRMRISFKTDKPNSNVLLSGFYLLNEHNQSIMGDYSNLKYLYKEEENAVILTDTEGDVWVEEKPYVPTEEELKQIFEENKEMKIKASETLLEDYLKRHPLVSNCHNGVDATYNVTKEKQTLMANNYMTYTIEKGLGLTPVLTWNATGCECETWTEDEYVALILQIKEYVKPLVALQQSYDAKIRACKTQEELDAIEIVYDTYGASV